MKKIIKNIPNAITISRIISCIMGAILFSTGNVIPSVCCYAYGALSDAIDGFLARKLNVVSEFGKRLDAISDKLFALSLMAPSIVLGNLFMILPMMFEGIISGINIYSDIKYKDAHTEKIGKKKTIVLFPTMILGLLTSVLPYLYILFIPLLYASLKLQVKSIEAYVSQLNDFKKKEEKESISCIKKTDIRNNKKEICKCNNKTKKVINSKQKKLVRKKD